MQSQFKPSPLWWWSTDSTQKAQPWGRSRSSGLQETEETRESELAGSSGHSGKPGQAVDVSPGWRRLEAKTALAFQEQKSLSSGGLWGHCASARHWQAPTLTIHTQAGQSLHMYTPCPGCGCPGYQWSKVYLECKGLLRILFQGIKVYHLDSLEETF